MPDRLPTPTPHDTGVPPAATPSVSGLMTLAVAVVVLGGLYLGREVFVPIVLAVLLAFVLAPLVDILRRWRLGRVPAVISAVILALGIILSLGTVIGFQVADLATDLPRYEQTVRNKVATLREGALGRLPEMLRSVTRQVEEATKETPPTATPSTNTTPDPQPLPVEVHEPDPTPIQIARNFLLPVVAPLATVGIVFVVLIFILLQREDLRDRMIRLFGAQDLHRTTVAMDDAARRLSRYFLIQLGLNASFGVMISIGLWVIGVPSPILWGIFAGLMRFVPYIGSILAGALPVALAAAVDPGWSMALLTLALFLITEPLMGHVVEPLVYGQSTGLSPFAVVMSAIFWTWLWGPIGLLLATPLTLCLVVLGRHVERLEFLDVLLGDRPALTPAENLYQRMLAGDPDEALDYAEQLLKERSLTSYYDDVVLAGLQLAANDASRGVLSGGQLERLKDAIQALVSDLGSHDDVEPNKKESAKEPVAPPDSEKEDPKKPPIDEVAPPPEALPPEWRAEGAVLCIAGRGPLDEAASTMLSQLLTKHGLGARVAPHEIVSRSAIMSLDATGVKMVCISYLEISGSPAHLRYLLRRLRQRLAPGTPMLVGLWPSEDAILSDEAMRKNLGADYTVSSLRQAVIACMEVAARNGEPGPISSGAPKAPASSSAGSERAPLPA
ncbi:MAG TPA: AI-2E family transporter [Microvirga sp.]|nr:AI-2E family transporter [Microvirga sp.]